jgi:hypothetical protein
VKAPRSIVATAALSLTVLTACGASAPPAGELAIEVIETLDVSDSVKACMTGVVTGFELTEEEAAGFDNFDDVAQKAADGNQLALRIMDDFEADLARCNNR